MTSLSIRLEDTLGKKLDRICKSTGYKKNTVVTRLIQAFVQCQTADWVGQKDRIKDDPFIKAIGIMKTAPLLQNPGVIDKKIYRL